MRSRTVVLAAMLGLAPLGARGADLVVWWQKGAYEQEDAALTEIHAEVAGDRGRAGDREAKTG